MKLRTRLLLGYGGFVLALAVLGAWSARTLSEMSRVSGRIIAENYDSVVAAQDMKESLERQDSAALFDLLGQRDLARRQAAEHRARFDAALARAAANITEIGEPDAIASIRRGRDDYYRRYDAFVNAAGDRPALYFGSLEPAFNQVRSDADRLLRLNQEAMRRKADVASQIARRWFFITLGLALVLMAAGVAIEVSLSKSITGPVAQLTAATTRMAAGELDTAVPVRSQDEIGTLAVGFNRMAERIRELRHSDLGRLLVAQQTTEAAIDSLDHLSEVSRLKSEFIAAASHELRTPLTSVQMGIHLLLEDTRGTLDERQREILQVCREDTARLDRLMRELLDLSKIDSGAVVPQLALVRPAALLAGAVDPLRLQVEARGIRLEVDAAPDLPKVSVDRSQIERVIANLVTNAMRATPADGTITVTATLRADEVAISVADTGTGVPRDDLPRIFEPFVQVPHTPGAGAGLGLTISRRIVEGHGGRLTVQSEPGHGSTFTFGLPLAGSGSGHETARH